MVGGGGWRVSKRPMHDYGEGEGGWPLVEISKEVFLQSHSVHPPPLPDLKVSRFLIKIHIY